MYTLLKPIQVREELLNKGLKLFTQNDFERIFNISSSKAKYFLERQTNAGFLMRLKRGLYMLETDHASEEEIANILYRPSYISFEYALAYYHVIPEMIYIVTSATTKPTRLFTINSSTFSYYTLKKEAFTGYLLRRGEIRSFLIAEPEKALVDYLYFVSLKKKTKLERINTRNLNKEKMFFYAKLFGRKSLRRLVSHLA